MILLNYYNNILLNRGGSEPRSLTGLQRSTTARSRTVTRYYNSVNRFWLKMFLFKRLYNTPSSPLSPGKKKRSRNFPGLKKKIQREKTEKYRTNGIYFRRGFFDFPSLGKQVVSDTTPSQFRRDITFQAKWPDFIKSDAVAARFCLFDEIRKQV